MSCVYLEYLGDSIELPVGETIIGRDAGCALRFNDPSVSRHHLKFIRRADDDVFVEDLTSSNGTLLNNRLIVGPIRVLDGDEIVVGTRKLAIRIPEDDDIGSPTLNLHDLSTLSGIGPDAHEVTHTARIPVTVPPPLRANQRCPHCGAAVSAEDDECASCGYHWGTFRVANATLLKTSPLNRRRHERHEVELHLVYTSHELEVEAITLDLSASGVFVCTQVLEPLGTTCELTLLIDGGPPLHVHGIVRRVVDRGEDELAPVGLGIEFLAVGPAERTWLESVLARQPGA